MRSPYVQLRLFSHAGRECQGGVRKKNGSLSCQWGEGKGGKKVYIKCMEMKICLSVVIQPKCALNGKV